MVDVKYPCLGCIYFPQCGDRTRTRPCDGRRTKKEQKKEQKK